MLEVDLEGSDESSFSEEIGTVVHAIKLEVLLDDFSIFISFLVFLNLYSKLEAKFVQPLEVILLAHELMEPLPFNFDVRHLLILNPNMKENINSPNQCFSLKSDPT